MILKHSPSSELGLGLLLDLTLIVSDSVDWS